MSSANRYKNDFGLPVFLADNLAVAFSTLDTDKSGSLDRDELAAAVSTLMPQLSSEARHQITDAIVSGADSNNDGQVDYAEFLAFVERRKSELDKTVSAVRHVAKSCGGSFDSDDASGATIASLFMSRLTSQCISSMFYTFAGSSTAVLAAQEQLTSQNIRSIVDEVFPELPDMCRVEIVQVALDISAERKTPLNTAQFVTAIAAPFEHVCFQSKRLAPLSKRGSSIAQLKRDSSSLAMENPLQYLAENQAEQLATGLLRDAAKRVCNQSFRDAVGVQYALRVCFDSNVVSDELIEDVTNVLMGNFTHGANCGVGELIRAATVLANQHEASQGSNTNGTALRTPFFLQCYSVTSLSPENRQFVEETFAQEEIDLLRDAFVRLDADGDGYVRLSDCCQVGEDVLGNKFAKYLPYLRAIFDIADKDKDGNLSLEEFILSFAEGPGVVPQEIASACVVNIRLRLTDDEILLVQRAFYAMDLDRDRNLDFKELLAAIPAALKPHFPEISEHQYQDVVDVIFSKADRNLDGKLNLSEFTRSLQEEQGVIPLQMIEYFGKLPVAYESQTTEQACDTTPANVLPQREATPPPLQPIASPPVPHSLSSSQADGLPATIRASAVVLDQSPSVRHEDAAASRHFEDAFSFLTLDHIGVINGALVKFLGLSHEYRTEQETRDFLFSELNVTGLPAATIASVVDVFVEFAHRNAAGQLSVVDVIRRFSLGQIGKPKRHSVFTDAGTRIVSGSVNACHSPEGQSKTLKVSQSFANAAAEEAAETSALQAAAATGEADRAGSEIFVPSAESTILERMFSRFDTDRDGFLHLHDIHSTLSRLLYERNPSWTSAQIDDSVRGVFVAADVDSDGRLSLEEFSESFRCGKGVFPDDYVQALSEQILLDLSRVNLSAVVESLEELERRHAGSGFESQTLLAEELERIVTPFVEENSYARVRIMVDYMMLFCVPMPLGDGAHKLTLNRLLDFIHTKLLSKSDAGVVADPSPVASVSHSAEKSANHETQEDSAATTTLTLGDESSAPMTVDDTLAGDAGSAERPAETADAPASEPPVATPLDNEVSSAIAEACVQPEEPVGSKSSEPTSAPSLMSLAPYEMAAISRIAESIAQAHASIPPDDLRVKLLTATQELFMMTDDTISDLANEVTDKLMGAAELFTNQGKNVVDAEAFVTACFGVGASESSLGFVVEDSEARRFTAVSIINELLPTTLKRRSLAEALLQVDTERTGEINFDALGSKLHEPLRDLSASSYSRLVRALRFVGEKTVLNTFSISAFLKPFATVYYVEPAEPLPTGGLLRRLSSREEELVLEVFSKLAFTFEDSGASHEVKICALAQALGKALVARGLTKSVSQQDLATVCRLVGEVVVLGENSLEALQEEPSKLHIPWSLLPSRVRCEYALRKLRVEVGEAPYLRKLCRVLLLTDRHRNGVFSHSVLSEALSSELRLLHRDWTAHEVGLSVEEWILAGEVDEKNFIVFGKMLDVMLEIFPLLHPALVGEVRVFHHLDAPSALQAALHHLAERGEVPAHQIKTFSSDGNGPVAPILNMFSQVGWIQERSSIDFGSIYPACRFDHEGMTLLLDGLQQQSMAQSAIFHVLSVARQRDLACAFLLLDQKKDNVLDFEEVEAVLVHHERALLKLNGAKTTSGIRSGRLLDVEIVENARRTFQAMDKMRLGLVTLEDFLAAFARGRLQYSLMESVIAVTGSSLPVFGHSPHNARSASPDAGQSSVPQVQPKKPESHPPHRGNTSSIEGDLKIQFDKADKKNCGYLTRAEFSDAYLKLEHFGLVPTKSEMDRLFSSICVDKEKMMFDEFCVVMLRRSRM